MSRPRISLARRIDHFRAGITGSAAHLSADNPEIWSDFDGVSSSRRHQIPVSAKSVVQIPEVFATLQVISAAAASLPLDVFERGADGTKQKAVNHPLGDLLKYQPNPMQTAFEFRGQLTWDLCLHRNAYAEIEMGPRGPVDTLWRLDPQKLDILVARNGRDYVYELLQEDGTKRKIDPENVMHLRALPLKANNLVGESLLKQGEMTFARALAVQTFAQAFFENGAQPSGVVTLAGAFKNPEQADELRRKWNMRFQQARNRHGIAILDAGGKYESIAMENDKAQFLETYKESALQCIRLWRMPPHKVGILDKATNNNIEHQGLEFVTDCLMPWLVAWEQGCRKSLVINTAKYYVEHNVAGLLRGDLKSRYEAYAVGRNWGWLSANDVRRLENMNDVDNGDVYMQPLNMVPAGKEYAQRGAYQSMIEREAALTSAINALRPAVAPRQITHAIDVEPTPAE